MDPSYFRCCCPRLHPFHRRHDRILLARKSQSRHHLAIEIHSLLHHMPFRFLHLLHRILEILRSIGQSRWRIQTRILEYHEIELKRVCRRLRDVASCRNETDEAWLYYYDPTIKQESSEWKHPSSSTPKKAKTVKSAGKVMTIIFFFYYEGIVYRHAVEPGSAENDSYYTNVLRTMVQHVKRKRPLLPNCFLLHHDNARPHIARCVLYVSQQNNAEILPHPPCSPDLTPYGFWLFPQLKKLLRSKRFARNKAFVNAVEAVL
ncbi:histone-lysine N-methyltransferase SETMAR [Trichonephila clavipes]|nr:histone-lysine N-methyltransferase SETMAR [Trichonephila clavipes]